MRIRAAVALLTAAALLAGVSVASAGGGSAPSTLTLVAFEDSNADGHPDYIIGTVSSPKRRCISNRKVTIFNRETSKVIDRTRSSANGYWAGGGVEDIGGFDGRVTAARKVLGHGDNKFVCKPDSELYD